MTQINYWYKNNCLRGLKLFLHFICFFFSFGPYPEMFRCYSWFRFQESYLAFPRVHTVYQRSNPGGYKQGNCLTQSIYSCSRPGMELLQVICSYKQLISHFSQWQPKLANNESTSRFWWSPALNRRASSV